MKNFFLLALLSSAPAFCMDATRTASLHEHYADLDCLSPNAATVAAILTQHNRTTTYSFIPCRSNSCGKCIFCHHVSDHFSEDLQSTYTGKSPDSSPKKQENEKSTQG